MRPTRSPRDHSHCGAHKRAPLVVAIASAPSQGAHKRAPLGVATSGRYPPRVIVRVQLRRDAHRAAKSGATWLSARQIQREQGPPDPGALAQIFDARGRELGWGLYAPDAKIRVRVLSWDPAPLADDWLTQRVAQALDRRRQLGLGRLDDELPTTGYREINSEGDGLPGVVVDRYGAHRVVQVTTAAMHARLDPLVQALHEASPHPATALVVVPDAAAKREHMPAGLLGEAPTHLSYLEHGLPFRAPAPPTQKTGAYHDQRENRACVAALAAADGRPLLDLGSHVGGFSIHAAARGVDAVAVDQSAHMLAFVERNAAALLDHTDTTAPARLGAVMTHRADIFAPRTELPHSRYGTIVFDPPKIATSRGDVPRARAAMTRALRSYGEVLDADGLLVVCSCSHHIDADTLDAVVDDALDRRVEALERRGPGADHPVAPGHARGEYLRVNLYRVA